MRRSRVSTSKPSKRRRSASWLLATSVLVVALAACSDDDSPTEPDVQPTSVRAIVTFAQPGTLGDQEETIRNSILATTDRAAGSLNFGQLMFSVSVDPARSIPGYGLAGYTLGPSDIEIVVDPAIATDAVVAARLPLIVAHEIHHTVRWRSPGPYGTLLDAFVFEGMADHFAVNLLGVAPAPWSEALAPAELDRFLALAQPSLDDPSFDFGDWFLGTRDKPVWTGYTLGYEVIGAHLMNNPGESAVSLVNEPTETFRPAATP
ncbi:MAG: DUF2268 domain-containing putative Zn-dependent protease [Acidobacteriota bacterium]